MENGRNVQSVQKSVIGRKKMSYVDEVIELVVKQNPAQPEFHQAVKEVLESLRVVIEQNEELEFLWVR